MIGSCVLHVSAAFQNGVVATGWELEKVLIAMWRLFQDSPARRDVYIKLNTCTVFALRFCPTRWVEKEEVGGRATMVWDNVAKVVQHYRSLCQGKRPLKHSAYETLVKRHVDPLMKVKIEIFKEIASMLNVFLFSFFFFEDDDNPRRVN